MLAAILLLSTVWAAEAVPYQHGTAGFSADLPAEWLLQTTPGGLELTRGAALLAIENLGINTGTGDEILSLFTEAGSRSAIDKPYPGRRAIIQGDGYSADVVILETPAGFFLVSLEQEKPEEGNRQLFESLLGSFVLLKTPPVDFGLNLVQAYNLGPVNIALPEGEAELHGALLFWRSSAGGYLTAEIISAGKGQSLADLLGGWEKAMLNTATGLTSRSRAFELVTGERPALQADYSGEKMQARVQVSSLSNQKALVLALIARKEAFDSHQPILDMVSFAATPADRSTDTPVPAHEKAARYNPIVESVSARAALDPKTVNVLYERKPALFSDIKATLASVDALETLLTDRPEKLLGTVRWGRTEVAESGLEELYAALRSFRVSTGLLPKGVVPQGASVNVVRRYVDARATLLPLQAYGDIPASDFKERDDLYERLVKVQGRAKGEVSAELGMYLQGKTDLYFRNLLEVVYQQSRAGVRRSAIEEALWQQRAGDLERIARELGR